MPDTPEPPPPGPPLPEPVVEKKKPWRLSPVWIVPIVAVIVGVAFEHPPGTENQPAPEGMRFFLFSDRRRALAPPDGPPLDVRMVFDHSVRGLAVGSPVDFLGVELGTVT